jgi:hypothetical protein
LRTAGGWLRPAAAEGRLRTLEAESRLRAGGRLPTAAAEAEGRFRQPEAERATRGRLLATGDTGKDDDDDVLSNAASDCRSRDRHPAS